MPWIKGVKEVCTEAICGLTAGVAQGIFGVTLFSAPEAKEIEGLKRLSDAIVAKSKKFATDPSIWKGIKEGSMSALQEFLADPPSEAIAATAAVVCRKAFKERLKETLMGACLTGCG